jgi:hypothetical protein
MAIRLMAPWGLARLQVDPLRTIMSAVGLLVKEIKAVLFLGFLVASRRGIGGSRAWVAGGEPGGYHRGHQYLKPNPKKLEERGGLETRGYVPFSGGGGSVWDPYGYLTQPILVVPNSYPANNPCNRDAKPL